MVNIIQLYGIFGYTSSLYHCHKSAGIYDMDNLHKVVGGSCYIVSVQIGRPCYWGAIPFIKTKFVMRFIKKVEEVYERHADDIWLFIIWRELFDIVRTKRDVQKQRLTFTQGFMCLLT